MFRIVCVPSSGSVERAWMRLFVIFFVCEVGVWQRDFEPAVCVPGKTSWNSIRCNFHCLQTLFFVGKKKICLHYRRQTVQYSFLILSDEIIEMPKINTYIFSSSTLYWFSSFCSVQSEDSSLPRRYALSVGFSELWKIPNTSTTLACTHAETVDLRYTGCPRRNVRYFGRVFLMLNYTDITKNTYIQSWRVTEIMAREVWNFDSCYSLTDYQIHIETGRNMWFL